jgi:hypothetical protein
MKTLQYTSVSLKVNMEKKKVDDKKHKIIVKKKLDSIYDNLVKLYQTYDNIEKMLNNSRLNNSKFFDEYNSLFSLQKDFCSKVVTSLSIIKKSTIKSGIELSKNDHRVREISSNIEDFVDNVVEKRLIPVTEEQLVDVSKSVHEDS